MFTIKFFFFCFYNTGMRTLSPIPFLIQLCFQPQGMTRLEELTKGVVIYLREHHGVSGSTYIKKSVTSCR